MTTPAEALAATPWPNEWLEQVVRQMPVGVIVAEASSGRILLANAAVATIWRHPPVPATSVSDYAGYQGFHRDGRALAPEEWPLARALATGEVVRNEAIAFLRGDGTRGTMRVTASPLHDADGRLVAGVVVFDDVTEEATARARVDAHQRLTAALADIDTPEAAAAAILREGLAALGANVGMIALLDQAGAALDVIWSVGFPAEQLANFQRLPLDGPSVMAAAVRQGSPFWLRTRREVFDQFGQSPLAQSGLELDAVAVVPLIAEGRTVGALGLTFAAAQVFDPDERAFVETVAARCALALQRAQFRAAERATHQRVVHLQRVAQKLARALSPDDAASAVVEELRPCLDAQAGLLLLVTADGAHLELAAHTGYPDGSIDGWERLAVDAPLPLATAVRTGEPVLVSSREDAATAFPAITEVMARTGNHALASFPLMADGGALGVLGLSFDKPRTFPDDERAFIQAFADQAAQAIDRARLYEAEHRARADAERAARARAQFLSIAAHELRTPITGLRGYAQLVTRRVDRLGTVEPDRLREAMLQIDSGANRLVALVEQLLDYTRLEAGKIPLTLVPTDLATLAGDVLDRLRSIHPGRAIFLDAPTSVPLRADPLRLEQVLTNLIDNAAKYSPADAPIEVAVAAGEDEARLVVRDHGPGIPEPERARIFDSNYQLENSHHTTGLGLGLYIARGIVDAHGGSIAVEPAEGGGARFVVRLPA